MSDRRRIDQPDVDINAIVIKITDAAQLVNIKDLSDRAKALVELYDATGEHEAHSLLMQDIVISKMHDIRSLPTATTTKTQIYDTYCNITGLSRRAAERQFKKVQATIKNLHNLGMVTHHAAAVAQDAISRVHTDLERIEAQEERLLKEIEDLDPNVEEQNKKIISHENRLQRIISSKNKSYELLLDYAKTFGVDLAIKSQQNTINEDKNKILSQKFDNDAQWQKADVLIRYKDMSPEEKRRALVQAISSDKGITETVESTFNAEIIDE